MAAALRTPSLKYRSFGNEPVRLAEPVAVPSEEQAFSILGEALAGANDLSPEAVLGDVRLSSHDTTAEAGAWATLAPARHPPHSHEPPPSEFQRHEAPRPRPHPPAPHRPPSSRPDACRPELDRSRAHASGAAWAEASRAELVEVGPARHHAVPSTPRGEHAANEDVAAAWAESALAHPATPFRFARAPALEGMPETEVLLSLSRARGVAAAAPADHAPMPPNAARREPQRHDGRGSALLQELLGTSRPSVTAAPPQALRPRPSSPGLSQGAPLAEAAHGTPASLPAPPASHPGVSTGSSLLDTLVGTGAGGGAPAAAGGIRYPLLDALGAAMRGTAAEPSPRHWPAARVDIALPELLRRVAAGVRSARSAA